MADQKELRFTAGEVSALLRAVAITRKRDAGLAPGFAPSPDALDSAARKLEVELALLR